MKRKDLNVRKAEMEWMEGEKAGMGEWQTHWRIA